MASPGRSCLVSTSENLTPGYKMIQTETQACSQLEWGDLSQKPFPSLCDLGPDTFPHFFISNPEGHTISMYPPHCNILESQDLV